MERPEKTDLPWQVGEAINVVWTDLIDFGSYRDQQRHRAVIQRMGLITPQFGMHEWYMKNLPPSILEEANQLVVDQVRDIEMLHLNKYEQQYLLPMGMKVPTRVQGSLAKLVYLIELRCQNTVHPTLHANVFKLAQILRVKLSDIFACGPEKIPFYINENVGEISLKRGTQDIIKTA